MEGSSKSERRMDESMRNQLKHYAWIGFWWLSLGFVIQHNSGMAGLAFLALFFLVSTWRKLGKIVILAIVVGVLCSLIPFLVYVAWVVGAIGLLLKGRFLIRNWRPLLVGLYTYGVYGFVLVMTKTVGLIAYLFSSRTAEAFASSGQIDSSYPLIIKLLPYIFTGVLAFLLHRMVQWLYRHDYDTDTAFGIMGVTPLIVVGFVMPFLKADMDIDLDDIDLDDIGDFLSSGSDAGVDVDADTDGFSSEDLTVAGKTIGKAVLSDSFDDIPSSFWNSTDTFITNLHGAQDIGDALWSSINDIPPQVHAAMAVAAAGATFALDQQEMIFRIKGIGKLKVKRIDETHAELLGADDCRLGKIIFDKTGSREYIKMDDGNMYVVNYDTGKICDKKGSIVGMVQKDSTGSIAIRDSRQHELGSYRLDGKFVDAMNRLAGNLGTR